jgi:hypothetical protein
MLVICVFSTMNYKGNFASASVYSYVLNSVKVPTYETEVFITILKDPAAVPYSESNSFYVASPYFMLFLHLRFQKDLMRFSVFQYVIV